MGILGILYLALIAIVIIDTYHTIKEKSNEK